MLLQETAASGHACQPPGPVAAIRGHQPETYIVIDSQDGGEPPAVPVLAMWSFSCMQQRGYPWQPGCGLRVTATHNQGPAGVVAPLGSMWDCTILLQQLVAMLEAWIQDSQAWRAEDITCEDALDQADQELWAWLLALEYGWVEALWKQNAILGSAGHK
ncbi:hypothetical protein Y1Q_0022463 [Alligator mississippiensis]|uniref:Uncharacterized protein n=1 Tax=Alligator mississippiensis TaxID=8496 RepID=A0A151N0H8_ALLMI|nr:hypothetical protein Y1Q_0022463 [Alligator mississippiensis]